MLHVQAFKCVHAARRAAVERRRRPHAREHACRQSSTSLTAFVPPIGNAVGTGPAASGSDPIALFKPSSTLDCPPVAPVAPWLARQWSSTGSKRARKVHDDSPTPHFSLSPRVRRKQNRPSRASE